MIWRIIGAAVVAAFVRTGSCDVNPWNPFTALRPGHLLTYFPFDNDMRDASPQGTTSQTSVNMNVTLSQHSIPSGVKGVSAYFNGESYVEVQVNINSNVHPEVTMGAWVFIPEYHDNHAPQSNPTAVYDASSTVNDSNRNDGILGGMPVKTGVWSFVAVSYSRESVLLYVDGDHTTTSKSSLRVGASVLRIGSGGYPGSGFYGFMNDVFVYNAALTSGELDFLRTTMAPTPPLPPAVGSAGYALLFPSSSSIQFVAPLPIDADLTTAVTLAMYLSVDFSQDPTFDFVHRNHPLQGDEDGLIGYWDMNYASDQLPTLAIESKATATSTKLTAAIRILAYSDEDTTGHTFLAPSFAPIGDHVQAKMNLPTLVLLNVSYVGLPLRPPTTITKLPERGTLFASCWPTHSFDMTTAITAVPYTLPCPWVYFLTDPDDAGVNYATLEYTVQGSHVPRLVVFDVAVEPIQPHFSMQDQVVQRLGGYRFEDVDTAE
ncbi:hypothetical protein DYB26_011563, partial [Aphanomyces astaci]